MYIEIYISNKEYCFLGPLKRYERSKIFQITLNLERNTMEVLEAIHSRRSVRKYKDKPIPEELIKELLSAAMIAPSAGNAQPWQFIVVDDHEKLIRAKEYS